MWCALRLKRSAAACLAAQGWLELQQPCSNGVQVWEEIDEYMDQRRRDQREKRLKEDLEKYRKENPKITEQFADLKRKLADVSQSEWEAIPDIGDYTIKRQKLQARPLPAPRADRQRSLPSGSPCSSYMPG